MASGRKSDLQRLSEELSKELDQRATSVKDEVDDEEPILPIRPRLLYELEQAVERHYGGKLPVKGGAWKSWRKMLLIADDGKGPSNRYKRAHAYHKRVQKLASWVNKQLKSKRDTKDDKPKKIRDMNKEARSCVRLYTAANRRGNKTSMKQVVRDYVEDHGGSVGGIIRRLSDNPDMWKKTT